MSNNESSAGVLVFCASTGRILLAQRAEHVGEGGTWSVFGGGVEDGEEAEDAAVRELEEEAGIVIDPDDLEHIHSRKRRRGSYETFLAVVDFEPEVSLNDENDAYVWCDLDDLPEPLHPGLAALVDEVDLEDILDDAD